MNTQTIKTIKLQIADLDQKVLPGWSVVAATGFRMPLNHPATVKTVLCDKWGITADYLVQRIQTLLLSSRPVDDPETITVHPGDVITLSGAMPGLAGAILRKGGILAGMRHSISAQNEATVETQAKWVTVKLFNLVIDDLRPLFFEQGIALPVNQGLEFLSKVTAVYSLSDHQLFLNGQPAKWEAVSTLDKTEESGVKIIIVSSTTQ